MSPIYLLWDSSCKLIIYVVYYESLKRELKTKTTYGYRCDERLKTNVKDYSVPTPVTKWELFFSSPKKEFSGEERDGTRKDTEDTTLVQIEEEVMRAIRALPFVTKLSPVGVRNSHGHGYQVSLRCPSCGDALLAKSMVAMERNKSHQFKSRAGTPHCTPVCRSC